MEIGEEYTKMIDTMKEDARDINRLVLSQKDTVIIIGDPTTEKIRVVIEEEKKMTHKGTEKEASRDMIVEDQDPYQKPILNQV